VVSFFQVKLSGRGDKPVIDWAGKGILATSTGEGVIRYCIIFSILIQNPRKFA
jgi:hypothetical protein